MTAVKSTFARARARLALIGQNQAERLTRPQGEREFFRQEKFSGCLSPTSRPDLQELSTLTSEGGR
jgi:hypothetical protein